MLLKPLRLSLFVFLVLSTLWPATLRADRFSTASETNVFIAEANLNANLQVLTDDDGGVYALKIKLTNMSKTNDLVLKMMDIPELRWRVILRGGKVLGKPSPKIKDYEMHYMQLDLARDSSIEWFIRLSDRIKSIEDVPERVRGGLAVNGGGHVKIISGGADGVYKPISIKFMLVPVTITREALKGDAAEKYEKGLKEKSDSKPDKSVGKPAASSVGGR